MPNHVYHFDPICHLAEKFGLEVDAKGMSLSLPNGDVHSGYATPILPDGADSSMATRMGFYVYLDMSHRSKPGKAIAAIQRRIDKAGGFCYSVGDFEVCYWVPAKKLLKSPARLLKDFLAKPQKPLRSKKLAPITKPEYKVLGDKGLRE